MKLTKQGVRDLGGNGRQKKKDLLPPVDERLEGAEDLEDKREARRHSN